MVCSWGLCSPSFPPSRLWSSRLALSFCCRATGLLFASGSVFLPSLPSWSVGSPGSPRLGVPLCSGVLFPGLSLFCISCSSGVLWPGGCFFPLCGLLLSGCIGSLIQHWSTGVLLPVACLQSSLPLRCRGSVFFLCLRFVLRLSPSVVFLVPSQWGHPGLG